MSSTNKTVLCVGSINADTFIELDRLPLPGETLAAKADSGVVMPGGKGANQAVAASLLCDSHSIQVKFAGQFGNDSHAVKLKQTLFDAHVGIDVSGDASVPSGQAFIFLQPDGTNSIVIVGGANHCWPDPLSSSLVSTIPTVQLILLQREIPERVNLQVAKLAYDAGVPVMLDMGGEATPISPQLVSYLFLLSANETELARLTGLPTDSDEEVITAAKAVQQMGVKYVLITIGARGAILLQPDGTLVRRSAYHVEHIVDTTGAGDTFRAAFAVGWLEGMSMSAALEYGSAAAAICITRKGAMPSIPSREETQARITQEQH